MATNERNALSAAAVAGEQKYANFVITSRDNMDIIRIDRADKKNAISLQMYEDFVKILKELAQNGNAVTVFTGTGDYFSSGNDLKNLMNADPSKMDEAVLHAVKLVEHVVAAFIDYPKPLIAVVNGHAVGIMVTLLALCDAVYATEKATFHTPFTQLGQSAEACSTYTFPRMMGYGAAADMLLFSNKITATEAHRRFLVTKLYADRDFDKEVWADLARIAALPRGSLTDSKRIIRDLDRAALHKANLDELKLLITRTKSEECMTAVLNFISRKSQL